MHDRPELMDELPEPLREATRLLRDTPEAGALWRERVLREVSKQRLPAIVQSEARRTRWTFHPVSAIAAGILCAVIGGATVAAALRARAIETGGAASRDRAASQSAQMAPMHQQANQTSRLAATAESQLDHAPVRFRFTAPGAAKVSVAGDFNAWNPSVLPLRRSADGRTWEIVVQLAPGRYAYAFVVDGKLIADPNAPQATDDDFGTPSSVVMVKGS